MLYPRHLAHGLGIAGSGAFCVWNDDLAALTASEVELVFDFTSNELLVSVAQPSELATRVHISLLFWSSFPCRSRQRTE